MRERIKAVLDRPIDVASFITGVLLGALLAAFVWVLVTPDKAEAAPAAGISCRISSVTTVQRTARVTIKSNKPIVYGQTSVQFSYYDKNMRQQWITRDAGYGAVVTVVRPAGAREWGLFKAWHAGTRCRDYAVGGPSGMKVSN